MILQVDAAKAFNICHAITFVETMSALSTKNTEHHLQVLSENASQCIWDVIFILKEFMKIHPSRESRSALYAIDTVPKGSMLQNNQLPQLEKYLHNREYNTTLGTRRQASPLLPPQKTKQGLLSRNISRREWASWPCHYFHSNPKAASSNKPQFHLLPLSLLLLSLLHDPPILDSGCQACHCWC